MPSISKLYDVITKSNIYSLDMISFLQNKNRSKCTLLHILLFHTTTYRLTCIPSQRFHSKILYTNHTYYSHVIHAMGCKLAWVEDRDVVNFLLGQAFPRTRLHKWTMYMIIGCKYHIDPVLVTCSEQYFAILTLVFSMWTLQWPFLEAEEFGGRKWEDLHSYYVLTLMVTFLCQKITHEVRILVSSVHRQGNHLHDDFQASWNTGTAVIVLAAMSWEASDRICRSFVPQRSS